MSLLTSHDLDCFSFGGLAGPENLGADAAAPRAKLGSEIVTREKPKETL
jgi:hypothetical protein